MSMARAVTDLSSIVPMRVFLIAGALIVGTIAGCGGDSVLEGIPDDERIPERPLRYAGKVALELQETIELVFNEDKPEIGYVGWMGISPEGTLMVTDWDNHQAHEINYRDNSYIRSFGRTGRGPGEHLSAHQMTIDPERRVYLVDPARGQVLRYDRTGRYLDRTEAIGVSKIHAGPEGGMFILRVNSSLFLELQRRDPATLGVLGSTPLSNQNQSFVSFRMRGMAHLSYNASMQVFYYLGPNDYMVKEIDAITGEITAQFGRRPKGFVALPDRFHDIGRGTVDDLRQLDITSVGSMTLVEDQYLFVSFNNPGTMMNEWVVYMINPSGPFAVFDLDDATITSLEPFRDHSGVPMQAITSARESVFIYRPPRRAIADRSIGTIEKYAVTLNLN